MLFRNRWGFSGEYKPEVGVAYVIYNDNRPIPVLSAGRDVYEIAEKLSIGDTIRIRQQPAKFSRARARFALREKQRYGTSEAVFAYTVEKEEPDGAWNTVCSNMSAVATSGLVATGNAHTAIFDIVEKGTPEEKALSRGVPANDVFV